MVPKWKYFIQGAMGTRGIEFSSAHNKNSILIYLRANLTVQRPATKLPQVRRKKQQQNTYQ
jgi:hypothetical protein